MSFKTAVGSAGNLELQSIVVCLGIDLFWKQPFTGAAVFVERSCGIWLIPDELICLTE